MGLTLNGRKVLDRTLLRGQEFILDADEDSSLTADTDDQLDLRLGGNDVFVFKTSELDISGVNIVNCGDIALDSISDDDGTGINIAMMDASATALTIKEATTAYLTFDTSNGTENIILGKKLTGGAVEIEGSAFDINGGTVDGITSLTVGTDGSGADVYFYSATGGDHLFWDSSEELLTITGTNGQMALNVADGNVIIVDTLYLFDAGGESLSSDGTDLTIASGALINLTATSDIVIPVNIGLIFGDGAEKIESNNTDFTINSGGELNLTATSDVVIPVNVGLHLGDGAEKLESNNTDLTINSGVDINLTATTDINVPANVGMTFGDDGEKIEGDGTDLTIASSGMLNLNATSGIAINGPLTITPGVAGTFLDFELETEWVSGTLIRADFGGATTLNNDTVVVGLDFNSNVSLTTDKDLTGYQIKLPAFTQSAANTTTIMGFNLPTAGALVQDTAAGTLAWKGINIQMPNITQTTGTVTSTGITITGGTVASGTSYGLIIDANAGNVGIGMAGPSKKLEVYDGEFALSNTAVDHSVTDKATANIHCLMEITSASYGGTIISGITDGPTIPLILRGIHGEADPTDTLEAVRIQAMKYDGGTGITAVGAAEEVFQMFNNTTSLLTVLGSGNVGINIAASLLGKLHIDQSSTSAAIPPLVLDQADLSEELIKFITTIGVGNPIEAIGGKTLTTTHFIRVEIPGPAYVYIPAGTIA